MTHTTDTVRPGGPPGRRRTASSEAPEAADPHERLHELTDLAAGLAVRAAVTVGPVGLVRQGVREPAPARWPGPLTLPGGRSGFLGPWVRFSRLPR